MLVISPEQYTVLHGSEQRAKWEIVKQLIRPRRGELLLDVGSGPVAWWQGWHDTTIAVDPFFEPPGALPVKARAEALPVQDKAVDYAVAISSLHLTDMGVSLAELARVTKKWVVVSVAHTFAQGVPFSKYFYIEKNIKQAIDHFFLLKPLK